MKKKRPRSGKRPERIRGSIEPRTVVARSVGARVFPKRPFAQFPIHSVQFDVRSIPFVPGGTQIVTACDQFGVRSGQFGIRSGQFAAKKVAFRAEPVDTVVRSGEGRVDSEHGSGFRSRGAASCDAR